MLLVILDLRSRTRLITIILDKVIALYTQFYLLVEVDLTNIYNITFIDNTYLDVLLLEKYITLDKI